MRTMTQPDEILQDLIHDLSQPLSNLETSLFYLELVLAHPSERVREQMRVMSRQVSQASQMIDRARQELRAMRDQCEDASAADSLPFTNSATAVVT
jgi:hypothetical protein